MTTPESNGESLDKPKINTMEELAGAIGVSRPTLSRYFQDPLHVRASTRARIQSGLDSVDYIPNFFATKMNRKRTGVIGVIIPQFNDLFYASLIEAIEQRALSEDFTVIMQSSHGDPEQEARAARKLMSMNADGVIIAPLGRFSAIDALKRMQAKFPLVFVDSRLETELQDVDYIGTDNEQSISLIVDYLCRTGKPPSYLGMPRLNSNSSEREKAYCKRMVEKELEPSLIPNMNVPENWEFEAYGAAVMAAQFGAGNYTRDTILCANDRLAIGAISAAHQFGLFKSPAANSVRFRIAGHDDHPLSGYVSPRLTTVSQDTSAIATEAVRVLIDRINNGSITDQMPVTREFPASLQLRDSA